MERHNNFDLLRLVAALSVIFSHAFLLAENSQDHDPLMLLTGGQAILGLAGVFVFFTISGYLITQSFETTASDGMISLSFTRALAPIGRGAILRTRPRGINARPGRVVAALVRGAPATVLPTTATADAPSPFRARHLFPFGLRRRAAEGGGVRRTGGATGHVGLRL